MYQSSFSCFDVMAPSPPLVAGLMLSAFLATIFVAACDDVRCFIRLELLATDTERLFLPGHKLQVAHYINILAFHLNEGKVA